MSWSGYYVLDEHDEHPRVVDFQEYREWLRSKCAGQYEITWRIRQDFIGPLMVSTVFLGIDHGWGQGEPVLWETMVFGTPNDFQERYRSHAAALARHAEIVAHLEAGRPLEELCEDAVEEEEASDA